MLTRAKNNGLEIGANAIWTDGFDGGPEVMTDPATRALHISDLIEEFVYGPRGEETPPCANAWEVSKLIASLEARLERLEAAPQTGNITGKKAYPIIGDVSWSESIIVPTTTIHPTAFDADS